MKITGNGTSTINVFPGKVYSLTIQGMASGYQILVKANGVTLQNGTITADTDLVVDPAPSNQLSLVTSGIGSGVTADITVIPVKKD